MSAQRKYIPICSFPIRDRKTGKVVFDLRFYGVSVEELRAMPRGGNLIAQGLRTCGLIPEDFRFSIWPYLDGEEQRRPPPVIVPPPAVLPVIEPQPMVSEEQVDALRRDRSKRRRRARDLGVRNEPGGSLPGGAADDLPGVEDRPVAEGTVIDYRELHPPGPDRAADE